MKKMVFLFLVFIIWGCLSQQENTIPPEVKKLKNLITYSVDEQPATEISFTKEVVYDDSKEATIDFFRDVAVDSLGRIFIAAGGRNAIFVFKANGQFHTRIGREGRGPGEFGIIKSIQIHENRLHVYDSKQQRVTVFTLDSLAVDKTHIVARNRGSYQELDNTYPYIYQIYARNNGTYLAEFISDSSRPNKAWEKTTTTGLFYQLDNTGTIASDKLLEIKEETRLLVEIFILPIEPFFGKELIVLSNDNNMYWAGPDHFLVKAYSPDGVYQYAFYYPAEKIPLTKETATESEVRDDYIKNMQSIAPPPTWPVITDMKIDDEDRLWIATTVKDVKVYQWWVLQDDGKLLARFSWPRIKEIKEIKGDKLYTIEENEETGVKSVIRYKMVLKKI